MGELLKRKHELLALNIRLVTAAKESSVQLDLATHAGGEARVLRYWKLSLEQLNVPKRLPPRSSLPRLTLPADFLRELSTAVFLAGDVEQDEPLWIYLIKPYGFLGAFDWEALLVPELNRPVLRLPDFLDRPRESTNTLDVAFCCSVPGDEPRFDAPVLLNVMARLVLENSTRPNTHVHIFADQQHRDTLTVWLADPRVTVHCGQTPPPEGSESAWLAWVQGELAGQSLDVVHFICHGGLVSNQPYLAVTDSPVLSQSSSSAQYLSVGEISAFLTRCGAWAAFFTAPPANYSPAGLRLFADLLAQTRPGTVLLSDTETNGWQVALLKAFRFLFSTTPQPAVRSSEISICCQPELVARQTPLIGPGVTDSLRNVVRSNDEFFDSDVLKPSVRSAVPKSLRGAGGVVPGWLSASQRYVENVAYSIESRSRLQGGPRSAASEATTKVAFDTLQKLQDVVKNVAIQSGGRSFSATHEQDEIA